VVTEEVFTLPGVGPLLLGGMRWSADYPLVQGTILFIAALFMLSNLGWICSTRLSTRGYAVDEVAARA